MSSPIEDAKEDPSKKSNSSRLRRATITETPLTPPEKVNTNRRLSAIPSFSVSEQNASEPRNQDVSSFESSDLGRLKQSVADRDTDGPSNSQSSRAPSKASSCNASILFGETRDIQTSRSYRKWKSMKARDLQKFFKDHPQTFYRRLRRGIPQRFRWEAWRELVHLSDLMGERGCEWALRLRPPITEDELVSAVGEAENLSPAELELMAKDKTPVELYEDLAVRPSKFTSLVDIDVARTFPEISTFDKSVQQKLHRILNAYANFAPNVGYCQGMNFVAGFIILVSSCASEAEVFWFFANLMSSQNVHGFFREHFPLLGSFITAFDQLAEHYIPEIRHHFIRENIQPPVYLHQWYLTLFVTSLPLGTVVVVWDSFLCNGLQSILPLTLALLKVLQSFILRLKFEGIVKFLKSLRSSGDCDESKIGRMLVRQAENYPLLPSVYSLVVNIDWDSLLREVMSKRRSSSCDKRMLNRTETLVDFEHGSDNSTKTNPLNVAIGKNELNSDEDDDNEDEEASGGILSSGGANCISNATEQPEEDAASQEKSKSRVGGRKTTGGSGKGFFPKFMGRRKPE